MNNAYRKLMEQQCLSEEFKQTLYNDLQRKEERKPQQFLLKVAMIILCVLLITPITVYAVETIFGISVVEILKGNTSSGKLGTGYEVNYSDVTSHKLSDFPEEIQAMEDYRLVVYDSWEQAEEALGITLVNNTLLFGENVTKDYAYNLQEEGIPHAHCFVQYYGLDNQFYRATITAAYWYDNKHITIRSTVTCEHPAISEEDMHLMHWSRIMYEDRGVEEIWQEQYLAENGINATIVIIDRAGIKQTDYEASFFANGASYRITVQSYDEGRDAEAKDTLIKILEGFSF